MNLQPRYDRYSSQALVSRLSFNQGIGSEMIMKQCQGYFDVKASECDARKLTRVLTERAKARSIAVSAYFSCSHPSINCYLTTSRLEARVRLYSIDLMTFKISLCSLRRADSSYLPLSLESLIEEDLEKLEYAKRGSVDDGGNTEHEQDQDKDQDKDKDDGEGNGDKPENKEGDSVNGDTEQLSTGSDAEEDEGPKDFENENADPITLGVRIYTQGRAVVSVTGQVTCEENDEQDKNVKEKNEDKDKKIQQQVQKVVVTKLDLVELASRIEFRAHHGAPHFLRIVSLFSPLHTY